MKCDFTETDIRSEHEFVVDQIDIDVAAAIAAIEAWDGRDVYDLLAAVETAVSAMSESGEYHDGEIDVEISAAVGQAHARAGCAWSPEWDQALAGDHDGGVLIYEDGYDVETIEPDAWRRMREEHDRRQAILSQEEESARRAAEAAATAWFEFTGTSDRPDDVTYGWGNKDEAEEYLAHLNTGIDDEEERYVMERVSDAKRTSGELDGRDDAFNLGDELIGIRAEAA